MGTLLAQKLEDFLLPPGKWEEATILEQRSNLFNLLEVYVDNFCALAQTINMEELYHITRSLLHSIHEVFLPPEVSGLGGKNRVSMKKLLEGKGLWETQKELLGWVFDGITRCIELPEEKVKQINKVITLAL